MTGNALMEISTPDGGTLAFAGGILVDFFLVVWWSATGWARLRGHDKQLAEDKAANDKRFGRLEERVEDSSVKLGNLLGEVRERLVRIETLVGRNNPPPT
jgi:hypothetical protein